MECQTILVLTCPAGYPGTIMVWIVPEHWQKMSLLNQNIIKPNSIMHLHFLDIIINQFRLHVNMSNTSAILITASVLWCYSLMSFTNDIHAPVFIIYVMAIKRVLLMLWNRNLWCLLSEWYTKLFCRHLYKKQKWKCFRPTVAMTIWYLSCSRTLIPWFVSALFLRTFAYLLTLNSCSPVATANHSLLYLNKL